MAVSLRRDQFNKAHRRDNRGATLVEAAIVMLPLCLIVFGIIEFGLIFKDTLSISNATRTAARTASADPNASPTNLLSETVQAAKTGGTAVQFNDGDTMCIYEVRTGGSTPIHANGVDYSCGDSNSILYTWSGGSWNGPTATNIFASFGTPPQPGPDVCLGDSQYDSIGVAMVVHHHSITGFYGSIALKEHTVMRLEPQESQSTCPSAS
jgi:hypothetical protein